MRRNGVFWLQLAKEDETVICKNQSYSIGYSVAGLIVSLTQATMLHAYLRLLRILLGRWSASAQKHACGYPIPHNRGAQALMSLLTGLSSGGGVAHETAFNRHWSAAIPFVYNHTVGHNLHIVQQVGSQLSASPSEAAASAAATAAWNVGYSIALSEMCKGGMEIVFGSLQMEVTIDTCTMNNSLAEIERIQSRLRQHCTSQQDTIRFERIMHRAQTDAESDSMAHLQAHRCAVALMSPPGGGRQSVSAIQWMYLQAASTAAGDAQLHQHVKQLLLDMVRRGDIRELLLELCPKPYLQSALSNHQISAEMLITEAGVSSEQAHTMCLRQVAEGFSIAYNLQPVAQKPPGHLPSHMDMDTQLTRNALQRHPECPVCLEDLTSRSMLFLDCVQPASAPLTDPVHVVCHTCWDRMEVKVCPVCRQAAEGYRTAKEFGTGILLQQDDADSALR